MKHKNTSEKWLMDYLFLLIILFLYGINIYSLTTIDFAPPMCDEAVHLRDSWVFYNILSNPSQISLKIIRDILNWSEQYPLIRPSGYYPPFAPIVTSFLYLFFGTSTNVAIMSNMIFLFILIFCTYKIGGMIFNRNAGVLACVLILLFPIVLEHSLVYMLDLPLAAMVAFSIFTLIKAESFKNTKFSVIFGFSFGLGMLTKWTYLFFILGPLCYSVLKGALYTKRSKNGFREPCHPRKSLRNIILFGITSVTTFGPYYFPILPILIEKTGRYSHGLVPGQDSLFSLYSAFFYLVALWKYMITPFSFILFATGIILLFFSKNDYKNFLLMWTVVPYLIFSFMIQNKIPRHMLPWLVSISVIASFWISEIESTRILSKLVKLRKYVIFPSLILIIIFFYRENMKLRNSIINRSKENWKIHELVSFLEADMTKNKKNNLSTHTPKYIGVIPDHCYINAHTISYYIALRRLPLNVIKLQNYKCTAYQEFVTKFDQYDYILTKNPPNVGIPSFQKSVNDMHRFFYSHMDNFRHLKTFYEPDGSEVSIFKRL